MNMGKARTQQEYEDLLKAQLISAQMQQALAQQSQYKSALAQQMQNYQQLFSAGGSGGGGGGSSGSSFISYPGATCGSAHTGSFRPGSWATVDRKEVHSGRLKRLKFLPNTLGWRGWALSQAVRVGNADVRYLVSPQQKTQWDGPDMHSKEWNEAEVVRGTCGIHALLAPELWRNLVWEQADSAGATVTGLVERFGRFVLGQDGWRAEWVIVRELLAPDKETAAQLGRAYPEVKIHVDEE